MKNAYEHRVSDAVSQRIRDAMGIKKQLSYAEPRPAGAVPPRDTVDIMRLPVWDGRVPDPWGRSL